MKLSRTRERERERESKEENEIVFSLATFCAKQDVTIVTLAQTH